ncbi:MAG: sigma 54-interacting transcriptional regulator [Clostridia bacterium]|nr:sigma 54-interacting transcriptional regulator [Clostridia bacterium]
MDRELAEDLRLLALQALGMGILITDEKGRVVYWNPTFRDTFELELRQGQEVNKAFRDSLILQVLKTGETIVKPVRDRQGKEVVLEEKPLLADGEIKGALSLVISQMRGLEALQHKVNLLQEEIKHYQGRLAEKNLPDRFFQPFLSNNARMQKVIAMANRLAATDVNILITGETGTGKELLTSAIHYKSKRANQPFIKVNCAAIPANLLESELFGYEKGAFTNALAGGKPGKFELANGGTIFLDEIGDMPLEMQAKILRVLQEREFERIGGTKPVKVDVRVIAATNKDLKSMVAAQTFREDLYFRLNVVELQLLPLRERREDLPFLVKTILTKLCQRYELPYPEIDPKAFQLLLRYQWPGNVRELENVLERALNLCTGNKITMENLPDSLFQKTGTEPVNQEKGLLNTLVEGLERQLIMDALEEARGNKMEAAKKLGISRTGLYKKLERYGLE